MLFNLHLHIFLQIEEEFKAIYPENDVFIAQYKKLKPAILNLSNELDSNIIEQIKLLKIGDNGKKKSKIYTT